VVGMRCLKDGYAKSAIPQPPYTQGSNDAGGFYQTDLLYQVSGTLPVLVEFPQGWQNVPDNHLAILDIGLAVLDEMCIFGQRYKFRPL
jgi:hypothetical protein